jgi:hypothetical protein
MFFTSSHKNNTFLYDWGLSTLGTALGYTQATCSWELFIFSSQFHTKTIHFSIIGDSQPSVQPWAIPRLHFHENCSYSLHIFTQNNTFVDDCGLSTLGTALGYTQATFSWKLFIFSSHFHTNTIHFSMIGDSQPSVQPWAIPRLHFHENCSYSLYIFTQTQYIFRWLGTLNPRYSPGLYPGYMFMKTVHILFTFSHKKQYMFLLAGYLPGSSEPSTQRAGRGLFPRNPSSSSGERQGRWRPQRLGGVPCLAVAVTARASQRKALTATINRHAFIARAVSDCQLWGSNPRAVTCSGS